LSAYADGELDADASSAVAAAIAADPELARRVARHRALRERLHDAYAPVLAEPVPERLIEAVRHGGTSAGAATTRDASPGGPARVVDISTARRPADRARWSLQQWGALAASLALGLTLGPLIYSSFAPASLVEVAAGMRAQGALAAALTGRLASDEPGADTVQIGISFRSRSGQFCRSFMTSGPAAVDGLACHDGFGWRVQLLEARPGPAGGDGRYVPAASAVSPLVRSAIDERISGEPLDANAERAARDAGWSPR
jgi:hypothetical protein